ncbi:MAG: SH3 domain-containing protein [Pseudomonadota bacterium]
MKRLTALALTAALFSGLAALTPITTTSAEAACVINVAPNDVLNVRSGPSTGNPIVGILQPGRCGVRIVQRSGSWGYVTWSNGQGWANLRFIGERGGEVITGCVTNVAFNDVLNIRAAGTSQSRILGVIPPNSCGVRVLAQNGSWARIRYNGVTGWVNQRYLRY